MWVDIQQNTDEWLALRAGKVGGSSIGKIMASSREYMVINTGKDCFGIVNTTTKKMLKKTYVNKIEAGHDLAAMKTKDVKMSFGDPAKKLAVNLAIEQITGEPILSTFSNDHMARGHDQEPIARALYEDLFFCDVSHGGFHDNGRTGISLDGRVYEDGALEIKSVIASVQFATIKRNTFDPSYKWQCIFNLKESKSEWLDYVSFCSEFPEGKQLFVHRLWLEGYVDEFMMIDKRLDEFWPLVDEAKQVILSQ